ncbi:MAG TPA: type II secretion system protein N [Usitatibacter sp.]|jgi:general secretion pathway protein N|nr:type II secretion system protein N [Usitatibacter sp.]
MVLTTPATFIGARASSAAGGQLRVSDAEGNLWSGSLRATLDTPGGPFALDRVTWRFMPGEIVRGRIAFDVAVDSRDARANAQLLRGFSDWEARGASARIDARALPLFYPVVAAWRPEGAVQVNTQEVRWNEREMQGSVNVEWRDASVALSDVRPLGTYRLTAQGVGESVQLALSTIAGALTMSGKGEVKLPRGTTFSGEARGESASAAALEPLLNLMGPRRADGARAIEVRIR